LLNLFISCLVKLSQPSSDAQGAIVASMPAGSFVGALLVTQLADRIGRKPTIVLSGLVWVIGSILQCASVVCVFTFPFVCIIQRFSTRTAVCSLLVALSLVFLLAYLVPSFLSINPKSPLLGSVAVLSPFSNGWPLSALVRITYSNPNV